MRMLKKLIYRLTAPFGSVSFCNRNPWLEKYEIGEWTYGDPKVLDWGEGATLKMGKFCSIGGGVVIFLGGEHRINRISTYPWAGVFPYFKNTEHVNATKGDVIIGNDVWIGDRATILSGVSIGNGAVIGASAVVTKDVSPYAVVAGNPAKLIKFRFEQDVIDSLKKIQWWDWPLEKILSELPDEAEDVKSFMKKHCIG